MQSVQWGDLSNRMVSAGAYRKFCMDYIDSLPAAMPWCEYIHVLQAVVKQLEEGVNQPVAANSFRSN